MKREIKGLILVGYSLNPPLALSISSSKTWKKRIKTPRFKSLRKIIIELNFRGHQGRSALRSGWGKRAPRSSYRLTKFQGPAQRALFDVSPSLPQSTQNFVFSCIASGITFAYSYLERRDCYQSSKDQSIEITSIIFHYRNLLVTHRIVVNLYKKVILQMARIAKFFKTIQNNWKKTVFATAVLGYGIDYAETEFE